MKQLLCLVFFGMNFLFYGQTNSNSNLKSSTKGLSLHEYMQEQNEHSSGAKRPEQTDSNSTTRNTSATNNYNNSSNNNNSSNHSYRNSYNSRFKGQRNEINESSNKPSSLKSRLDFSTRVPTVLDDSILNADGDL